MKEVPEKEKIAPMLEVQQLLADWRSVGIYLENEEEVMTKLKNIPCMSIEEFANISVPRKMDSLHPYMMGTSQAYRLFNSFGGNPEFNPLNNDGFDIQPGLADKMKTWKDPGEHELCGHLYVSNGGDREFFSKKMGGPTIDRQLEENGCYRLFDRQMARGNNVELENFKLKCSAFFVRNQMATFGIDSRIGPRKNWIDKHARRTELLAQYYGLWTFWLTSDYEQNHELALITRCYEDVRFIVSAMINAKKEEKRKADEPEPPKSLVVLAFGLTTYMTDRFLYRVAQKLDNNNFETLFFFGKNVVEFSVIEENTKDEEKWTEETKKTEKVDGKKMLELITAAALKTLNKKFTFIVSADGAVSHEDRMDEIRTPYLLTAPIPTTRDSNIEVCRSREDGMSLYAFGDIINRCVLEARDQKEVDQTGNLSEFHILEKNFNPQLVDEPVIPQNQVEMPVPQDNLTVTTPSRTDSRDRSARTSPNDDQGKPPSVRGRSSSTRNTSNSQQRQLPRGPPPNVQNPSPANRNPSPSNSRRSSSQNPSVLRRLIGRGSRDNSQQRGFDDIEQQP